MFYIKLSIYLAVYFALLASIIRFNAANGRDEND
jgi:hypothetical protein